MYSRTRELKLELNASLRRNKWEKCLGTATKNRAACSTFCVWAIVFSNQLYKQNLIKNNIQEDFLQDGA